MGSSQFQLSAAVEETAVVTVMTVMTVLLFYFKI
jgi:hypothetical protein